MTNKRGQFWTPKEGKELVDWWNGESNLPHATWDDEVHARFLDGADLVDGAEHVFIAIEEHGEHALATFLFVAEQYRAPVALSRIYKGPHDQDARWVERLAPALIEKLGLDLHYDVVEASEGRMVVVRTTRSAAS